MSRWAPFALVLAATPAAAEAHFFASIDDLPLPPGLSETSTAFVFDGGEGRIVEASAAGTSTLEAVRAFYADCLPALGWSASPGAEGPMHFLRGREELSLTVRERPGALRLDVRLVTRPASMRLD